MRHRSRRLCLSLAVAAALAACSSAPPVRIHTLMPPDLPARNAELQGGAPIAIVLEPVRVPAQVDQPQWLVRLPDGSMALLEQDRWASALRDELRQALREQVIARYGVTEARPAQGSGPIRVSVDVRRFDTIAGKEARTEGSWMLASGESTGGRTLRCEWLLREPASGDSIALAAAHRRVMERLGEAIGAALTRLSRMEPAACPARDAPG